MKILFWVARSKKDASGKAPIYCRITINGQRAEIATGIIVKPIDFDTAKKRVKNNALADDYNKSLEKLTYTLNRIYFDQTYAGTSPNASHIKDLYTNKISRISSLSRIMIEFINERFDLNNNERQKNQDTRYMRAVNDALINTGQKHVPIDNCNHLFYDRITNYLYHVKEYSVAYMRKIIGFLRGSLMYAYNRGFTSKFPISYSIQFKETKEIVFLTEAEVNKIALHSFAEKHLQRVADCFLVQCYTGLAYADLKNLDANNIHIETDGLWIQINRQKVKTAQCTIPVLKNVKELLYKYNYKMPVISNQKYNAALKTIGKELNLRKNLTTHVGRKTFGTLLLNKDVPIETVSALLGHSNIRTTQRHYAKVLHTKVAKDLRLVM